MYAGNFRGATVFNIQWREVKFMLRCEINDPAPWQLLLIAIKLWRMYASSFEGVWKSLLKNSLDTMRQFSYEKKFSAVIQFCFCLQWNLWLATDIEGEKTCWKLARHTPRFFPSHFSLLALSPRSEIWKMLLSCSLLVEHVLPKI